MTDLNVPSFHHGGGTVAYSGQMAVPCGVFSSGFTGPSPPPGQVHTYQFNIKALGPNGAVLASFRSDNRPRSGMTCRVPISEATGQKLNADLKSIFTACAGLNAARAG